MSYKVNTKTGEVKNWEEFHSSHYLGDNPSFKGEDIYSSNWDEWVPIEVDGNLEKVREKMRFIYNKSPFVHKGDLIKTDLVGKDTYYRVEVVVNNNLYCQNILTHKVEIFDESTPIIKVSTAMEEMRKYQMSYNIAMNNKNRYDSKD